jgi:hypothetical protein
MTLYSLVKRYRGTCCSYSVYQPEDPTNLLPDKLLLVLASTVTLASESRASHYHILPSHDSGYRATLLPVYYSATRDIAEPTLRKFP